MQMISGTGLFDISDEEFDGIWYYDEGRCIIQFKNTWILISEKQYEEIVNFLKNIGDDNESKS